MHRNRLRITAALVALPALSCCGQPSGDAASGAAQANAAAGTTASCRTSNAAKLEGHLAALERGTDKSSVVRMIVTVAEGADCADRETAKNRAAAAFRAHGALVEPMDGLPYLVVECTTAQLRAVAQDGWVEDVESDDQLGRMR